MDYLTKNWTLLSTVLGHALKNLDALQNKPGLRDAIQDPVSYFSLAQGSLVLMRVFQHKCFFPVGLTAFGAD